MAEPIGPKFCVGPHMTHMKMRRFQKNNPPKFENYFKRQTEQQFKGKNIYRKRGANRHKSPDSTHFIS